MQLISPDVLSSATGLSYGAAGFGMFVGLLLWGFGWRWQKFWVAFGITTTAGVLGLSAGQTAGGQVLAIGVLLAFAGGVMAQEVAKVMAFVAGGVGAWLAVQAVLPAAQELWAVFLSGGLFGVILYRLWTMLLTSFAGVLVSWHAGLVVIGPAAGFEPATWAAENAAALNGAALAVTLLGVGVQALTARAATDAPAQDETKPKKKKPKGDGFDDLLEKKADKKASWWTLKAA